MSHPHDIPDDEQLFDLLLVPQCGAVIGKIDVLTLDVGLNLRNTRQQIT